MLGLEEQESRSPWGASHVVPSIGLTGVFLHMAVGVEPEDLMWTAAYVWVSVKDSEARGHGAGLSPQRAHGLKENN